MKKIFCLLLSFIILLSVCVVSVYASSEGVTLSFEFTDVSLLAGSKVNLNAETNDSYQNINLLFSDDNNSYTVVDSSDAESSVSFVAELVEGPNWFMAQITDGDGTVLASSEPIMIEGYGEVLVRDVWNVDFNSDINAAQKSASSTTIQFKNDAGTEVVNADSSKLAADIGIVDAGNSISVAEADVDSSFHGKALKIVTAAGNGSKVSQLNSFSISTIGTGDNAVIIDMDYLFESNNSKTTVMAVNDGSSWYSALMLESGIFKFAEKTFTPETGKWYKVTQVIDYANDTITCFIDDKILGSASASSVADKTTRVRFSHEKASASVDAVTWVDNFKVREVKFQKISKEKIFAISAENYTKPIYSGNKTAFFSDVQNYTGAAEVQYFVSEDGDDYIFDTSSVPGKSADVTLPYETTYVKAVLINGNGDELAETEALTLSTVELTFVERVWDVDFETETTSPGTSNSVIICDENGEELKNAYGNSFKANTGSSESKIEITDNGLDPDYGKSLRFYVANANDEVQINELRASVMSDVIMAQWDCFYKGEPTLYIPLRMWYLQNSSIDSRYDGAYLKQGATTVVFEGSGASLPVSSNTWYNMKMYVNTKTGQTSCYINDKYLGTSTTTKDIYSLFKVANTIKGEGAECYVDNIKIERLCFKPEIADAEKTSDKELKISFKNSVPADFFPSDIKTAVSLSSGNNSITIKDAALSEDGAYLTVTTSKNLFTAVDIDICLELTEGTFLEKTVKLPAKDFDVTGVTFTSNGLNIGAKATVANKTDSAKSVIMFFVAEKDGGITSVTTTQKEIAPGTSDEISVPAQSLDGGTAKVFFLDNWTNLNPIKTYVYTR